MAPKAPCNQTEGVVRVGLAGNPNSGKTSLFNCLTGSRQHVGNYPGVTVEKKAGHCNWGGFAFEIVDLPGIYSFSAYSPEEKAARDFLLKEKPDLIINVVDASNLERNLYLTRQLLETGVPVILSLNMIDHAQKQGVQVDTSRLASLLGVPVVETVGSRGRGIRLLLDRLVSLRNNGRSVLDLHLKYPPLIESSIEILAEAFSGAKPEISKTQSRWLASHVLENGSSALDGADWRAIAPVANDLRQNVRQVVGESIEMSFAQIRYQWAEGIVKYVTCSVDAPSVDMTEQLDRVLTHKVWGLPIFLGTMFMVFELTFLLSKWPMDWIEALFSWLRVNTIAHWPFPAWGALKFLIGEGIIGGVGGVLVFLPNIVMLFLAISLLEDSGYLPRAAFLLDRLMRNMGLHGKSFIPLLLGFGCSVPAIMATRTLEHRRDRLTTMLVIPLMSCGARLPIYSLIIPAFFPVKWQAPVLWTVYTIGILFAVLLARLLRFTLFRGSPTPFVMELPGYHIPTPKSIFRHMVERSRIYLKKAGTTILAISLLLWVLANYPRSPRTTQEPNLPPPVASDPTPQKAMNPNPSSQTDTSEKSADLAYSVMGRIGRFIEPALRPLGFDWRIGTALIGALSAKEVFVAQMGIITAVEQGAEPDTSLRQMLRHQYSPLTGFCLMLFCLLSTPCMSTFAVIRRESGSWAWAGFQLVMLTLLAYLTTGMVFQLGSHWRIGL